MRNMPELSIKIKKMCIDKKITQRKLVAYLRENGYPNVNETMLSNMLGGVYNYGMAQDVLNTTWNYLNENVVSDERNVQSDKQLFFKNTR